MKKSLFMFSILFASQFLFNCGVQDFADETNVSTVNIASKKAPESKAKSKISLADYLKLGLFASYIVGNFDNQEQYDNEMAAGTVVHPFAKHVNRIANQKIKNLPKNFLGFFIIEESYYTFPNQATIIKPLFFKFDLNEGGNVRLTSYQIPQDIPAEEFRNDNPNLTLDYNTLQISPTFSPSPYAFTPQDGSFNLDITFDLGSGKAFTLQEKIAWNRLQVLEQVTLNGKRIYPPYDTPIIFQRKFAF